MSRPTHYDHTDILFVQLLLQTNIQMSNKEFHSPEIYSFLHLNSSVKVGDTNRNEMVGFTHHFSLFSLKKKGILKNI